MSLFGISFIKEKSKLKDYLNSDYELYRTINVSYDWKGSVWSSSESAVYCDNQLPCSDNIIAATSDIINQNVDIDKLYYFLINGSLHEIYCMHELCTATVIYLPKPFYQLWGFRNRNGHDSLLVQSSEKVIALSTLSLLDDVEVLDVPFNGLLMLQLPIEGAELQTLSLGNYIDTKPLELQKTLRHFKNWKFFQIKEPPIYFQPNFWSVYDNETILNFTDQIFQLIEKSLKNILNKFSNVESISVAFSGGIDCTLIVLILMRILKKDSKIILFNAACGINSEATTDRRQYRFYDLLKLSDRCQLIFIPIKITLNDLKEFNEVIVKVTKPGNTVMEYTLNSILFILTKKASQCYNYCVEKVTGDSVVSMDDIIYDHSDSVIQIKPLLSGQGADELFGGYSKYITKLKAKAYSELRSQMIEDLHTVLSRGAPRDKRAASVSKFNIFFPYLSKELIQFVGTIPISQLYLQGRSKSILRDILKKHGSFEIADKPKTAAQFGSKISRLVSMYLGKSSRQTKGYHMMPE